MDQDLIMLLQAIAINDLNSAKIYAKSFSERYATNFDSAFFSWLQSELMRKPAGSAITSAIEKLIEPEIHIPPEVASLIVYEGVEDLLLKFNPRRYWVSPREKILLDDITEMSRIGDQLLSAQIPYSNTTLLFGQPGTGKTQFGRYVAYELKRPFIYVNLCRIMDPHQGGTARNLETIFDFVQTINCVFVLDEIDAIGANRGMIGRGGSGDEATHTTLALMQCMDRLRQDVVIVATTNRLDMLDAALKRRFSVHHEIKAFLQDERLSMVESYLEDVRETGNLDISWDHDDLKRQCSKIGAAQSEVINLCNRAVIRAIRTGNMINLSGEATISRC